MHAAGQEEQGLCTFQQHVNLPITLICEQLLVMQHQADAAGCVVVATSCVQILLSPAVT